jgi:trehalose/maltose hydrolase-like predicted phosphorylase
MSPDEYSGNSSDPPYTTAVAQITLRAALDLAPLVGQQPDESLRAVVRKTLFGATNCM